LEACRWGACLNGKPYMGFHDEFSVRIVESSKFVCMDELVRIILNDEKGFIIY